MTKKQKKWLIRILLSGVLFITLFILEHVGVLENLPAWACFTLFLVPYGIIGYDILWKAMRNISHGKIFDENFLMMIATFGAFAVQEFSEAVAVMLFYQTGELFQNYAVGKSRQSITEMMEIVPEYANIEEDGSLLQVDPDDIEIGTVITILPGERIPLDGVVTEGSSLIDTAALTGESVPRSATVGDEVISGCVNGSGTLKVRTTKEFDDSTVSKILELVESASEKKARAENFITRFAKYYTPCVTIAAVLLALIPSLITGEWALWLRRACIFLVISCPCALVISVPLGFFGGIGAASRIGVLVKGSNYLELVSSLDTVVFDKTGTLTKGEFSVQEYSSQDLLFLAAHAEGYSNHPIAVSLREAYTSLCDDEENSSSGIRRELDLSLVEDASEISGHGVKATVQGRCILVGNDKLMKENGISYTPCNKSGTIVYLADVKSREYLGYILISDTIKEGVKEAISDLHTAGVTHTVMLTGDHRSAAEDVALKIGIDLVKAELLPQDKVSAVEELLDPQEKCRLAFVGDGINDAPVLMRADIGFAMGSMGSDAAIEAADIVIMDDDLTKISKTIRIARKTMRIVKENIVFALGVKFAILILGAIGFANMWAAVFSDVGVAVIAILNSMRMLKKPSFSGHGLH